jgi:hypothetical protein
VRQWPSLSSAVLSLNQLLDQWLTTVVKARVRTRTFKDYEALLKLYIRPALWEGVAGGNGPLRFSLACLGFSFLFRGVQRGYFSFQRERSEIMKVDELLISAKELPWQKPISLCRSRLSECLGDLALIETSSQIHCTCDRMNL